MTYYFIDDQGIYSSPTRNAYQRKKYRVKFNSQLSQIQLQNLVQSIRTQSKQQVYRDFKKLFGVS